jgi:hypothetical protein
MKQKHLKNRREDVFQIVAAIADILAHSCGTQKSELTIFGQLATTDFWMQAGD